MVMTKIIATIIATITKGDRGSGVEVGVEEGNFPRVSLAKMGQFRKPKSYSSKSSSDWRLWFNVLV